jgi:type IX secretion system PorP/SprF family membrane protein
MFNLLTVNPAYAGANESLNLCLLNRNQWQSSYAIRTTVFYGDMPVKLLNLDSGLGLNYIGDEIGFFKNNSLLANYSIRFQLEKGSLAFGIKAGFISQTLDGSEFKTDLKIKNDVYQQDDSHIPTSEVSGHAFDMGLGAFYQNDNWYASVSMSHLNKPRPDDNDNNFYYKVKGTLYLTGGYNYKVEDMPYELLPSLFYKTDGVSFQVDLNTLVRYKKRYWGGLTYRFQDAVVILAGVEMKNGVRFGCSYDVTTSAIATAGKGNTWEVVVGYNLDVSFEKRVKRYKSVRYL